MAHDEVKGAMSLLWIMQYFNVWTKSNLVHLEMESANIN